jgi:hypothetical protein
LSAKTIEELEAEKTRLEGLIYKKSEEVKHAALPRNLGKSLGGGASSEPDKKSEEVGRKAKNDKVYRLLKELNSQQLSNIKVKEFN